MSVNKIQAKVYDEYVKNGYLAWLQNKGKEGELAEIGLITTEIAEAMEEIRNPNTNYQNVMFECADIIIRTLNFMSRMYEESQTWTQPLKLASFYVHSKHRKNLKRGWHHGREL